MLIRNADQGIALRRHLTQTRANDDQQINLLRDAFTQIWQGRDSKDADIIGMVIVDVILTAKT